MAKKVIKITEGQLKKAIEKAITENVALSLDYQEPLLEMARIDNPHKDATILGTKEIWVYGNDRSSMTPHFHYSDKKGSKRFDVEVKIDDLSICFSQPRKGVKQSDLFSWVGLETERKALLKWLNSPNADVPSITNYVSLKLSWNQNNRDNPVAL